MHASTRHYFGVVVGLRRAKLKSEFGSLYPELPAEHWVPALQLVIRRAERIWREHGAQALIGDRLLPDEHFDFKGGRRRASDWHIHTERLSDSRSNRVEGRATFKGGEDGSSHQ
jgi:hypothetical protein